MTLNGMISKENKWKIMTISSKKKRKIRMKCLTLVVVLIYLLWGLIIVTKYKRFSFFKMSHTNTSNLYKI